MQRPLLSATLSAAVGQEETVEVSLQSGHWPVRDSSRSWFASCKRQRVADGRDSAHGNHRRTVYLPAETFIDRFLLHILPKGFKRIRRYGVLGPAGKAVKLARARAALSVPTPDPVGVESVAAFVSRIDRLGWGRCWHCGQGALCRRHPFRYRRGNDPSREDRREFVAESDFVGQAWPLGWPGIGSTLAAPGLR